MARKKKPDLSKFDLFKEINKAWTLAFVKSKAKEKVGKGREDKRYFAIILLELILVGVLVVAIYLWLDTEINLVPWPYNVIAFAAALVGVLWLYQYTLEFRSFA